MNIDQISVKDFATYNRPESLDLRQLGKTVSVFGSTGAGKTTFFIDTLTLSLYGRAYGQQDKESAKWILPTKGSSATVILEFTIGDKRYKVERKVNRARQSEAKLSQILSQGHTKALAVGVREVEKKLEEIVGFDHQTFLNTVVVRQGDVSALINQDPKGRREIFLRAFDVDYTRHKEKAREQREKTSSALKILETEKDRLEEAIREKPTLNTKLTQTQQRIGTKKSEKQQLLNRLQTTQKELELLRTELTSTQAELKRYEQVEKELEQLQNEQIEKDRTLQEIERLVLNKPKILLEEKETQSSLEAHNKVSQDIIQIDSLNALLQQIIKQKKTLSNKTSKKERVKSDLEIVYEREQELPDLRTQLSEINATCERLNGETERLKGSVETVKKSLIVLESVGEDVAACPICKTPLSKDRLHETKKHLEEEVELLHTKIIQLEPQISRMNKERKPLEEQVREYEKSVAIKKSLEEDLAEIHEADDQLGQIEEQINGKTSEIRVYEEHCKNLLGYVPTKKQLIEKNQIFEERLKSIRNNLERIAKAEGQITEIRERLEKIREHLNRLIQELVQAQPLKMRAEELQKETNRLQKVVEGIQTSLREVERQLGQDEAMIGELKERLQQILAKEEDLAKTNEAILEQTKNLQTFELLYSEVFHEKGFPLALLQDFLQDVELHAQNYIARFLPDKSVRIEADEAGRVAIDVIDGAAIRELATYSGGETVLIGFAIRLGIAKAIVERNVANAPHFLIIDEGFGPLSPEFRREILKTLNELSRDYDKIIVISHVDDVRESPFFTSQIHVSKDPDGYSHLEVLR